MGKPSLAFQTELGSIRAFKRARKIILRYSTELGSTRKRYRLAFTPRRKRSTVRNAVLAEVAVGQTGKCIFKFESVA